MQRVLIVDDNPQNLYFLEVLLKRNGFETCSALDGAEALEAARNNPPDLIISDILMPVMDGYALCREWRADERLRQIPFIFYTATFTEKKDEELALSLGGNRFLVKPLEPDVLLGIIREVLTESRSGAVTSSENSFESETDLLREYSEALVRKLEKKMFDLEEINRELLESEQYFRHFVMECPLPVGISDRDGRVWLLNKKFVEQFGYTLEEIKTLDSWWLLAYPDPVYREEVMALWQKTLGNTDSSGSYPSSAAEFNVTCKDGQVRTLEIHGSSILNRLMVIFTDITDRKMAEKTLLRHNDELEERVSRRTAELEAKVAELDAFTLVISHDLRAPIRQLCSYSQILLESLAARLNDEDTHILTKIQHKSTEAMEMVNALLELSRLGKAEVVRQEVDLSGMATATLNEMTAAEPERRHLFDVAVGLRVQADRQLLQIVLTNLLGNAWKFCAKRPETRISLTEKPGGNGTIFCIADNGAGFDMQYADKLFIPFQRLHRQDEFPGVGIGLATVNSIIHLHGGRLWAESEPDKGAKFYFTLG